MKKRLKVSELNFTYKVNNRMLKKIYNLERREICL